MAWARGNQSFRQKVRNFARKVETAPEQCVRAVGLNLLRSVVYASPVDTGRFRGNWQVQYANTPEILDNKDTDGTATIDRGLGELSKFKLGTKRVYFLNHLPYSIRLEYGHSEQAPSPPGIVRLTVQRFDDFMRKVAEEIRNS